LVVVAVAVVAAVVGVLDECETVAVELRTEDPAERGAIGVNTAAAGVA
jgi:hypothetical protein